MLVATIALAAGLLVAPSAQAQPTPAPGPATPSAELRLSPERAFMHQQVVLELRVRHPVWARPTWVPPAFEGFWTERLSSIGEPMEHDAAGRPVRTTLFRRALFPTRSGALEIPASRLRYRDSEQEMHEFPIPGGRIQVDALPQTQRPEHFSEVVGRPAVETYVSQTEVGVGRGVRLVVDFFGSANVWDATLPEVETALGPDVEVFAEPPRLAFGENLGQLTVRRTLRFDLVPRRRGRFEIPAFELPYFDPEAREYRTASSDPIELRVVHVPRRPGPFAGGARPTAPPAIRVPWLPFALIVGAVGLVVSLSLTRWWRAASGPRSGAPLPSPRVAFQVACDAIGNEQFAARLAEAVKAGVHVKHHCDALPLTTEEIASRVDDPEAIEILRELDRARFARSVPNPERLVSRVRIYLRL
jgi:hypothetical protein